MSEVTFLGDAHSLLELLLLLDSSGISPEGLVIFIHCEYNDITCVDKQGTVIIEFSREVHVITAVRWQKKSERQGTFVEANLDVLHGKRITSSSYWMERPGERN